MPNHQTLNDLSARRRTDPNLANSKRRLEVPVELIAVKIAIAVQMSGIGRSRFYELIKESRIETIKVGTATLVPVASLRCFLESQRRKPPLAVNSHQPAGGNPANTS